MSAKTTTDLPEHITALPLVRVTMPGHQYDGRLARGQRSRGARGTYALWLTEGHPYRNERNPGGIGSALFLPAAEVTR